MLERFTKFLSEQNKKDVVESNGYSFIREPDGDLIELSNYIKLDNQAAENRLSAGTPPFMQIATLTGILDYIHLNPDKYINSENKAIIQIASPTQVKLHCQLTKQNERPYLLDSVAITPAIQFTNRLSIEEFIILLNTKFAETEHKKQLLELVSKLSKDDSHHVEDDGFTQKAIVKTGISLSKTEVPNPVTLAPFRTFIEVEQPRSLYLCRLHNDLTISLHDADGGEWRIQAIQKIKKWFEDNLSDAAKELTYILA